MNELFDREGCLTDFALRTLMEDGQLEELERLEIAEHLSFCDRCVARYGQLLEQRPLEAPPEPLAADKAPGPAAFAEPVRHRGGRRLFCHPVLEPGGVHLRPSEGPPR